MWERRRSRFCWEAFIAHEKASCLLKSYLQSAAKLEARGGSLGPHRVGDCFTSSCRVGWVRGTRTVDSPTLSPGWKECLLQFKAISSMEPTDCFPGEVFVWALVPLFAFLCPVLALI